MLDGVICLLILSSAFYVVTKYRQRRHRAFERRHNGFVDRKPSAKELLLHRGERIESYWHTCADILNAESTSSYWHKARDDLRVLHESALHAVKILKKQKVLPATLQLAQSEIELKKRMNICGLCPAENQAKVDLGEKPRCRLRMILKEPETKAAPTKTAAEPRIEYSIGPDGGMRVSSNSVSQGQETSR
ncbi:MAG: hypothetical protein O7D91_04930 [Planctomycetota bacterium]|nr:hypothetical protein [Planctomycetota bacterium]